MHFDIHCPTCNTHYLVGFRSLVGFANTEHGPVAEARCPNGHLVTHAFHRPADARLPAAS